ncbi:MAG: DUF4114 domain-containing protein [Scytonema sp. PMC 1069.18]|nr:DUF4114 domain-containing protein [Scytonema sp. PMC 1069.18]MEC4887067.1 DUF4114 domain-containing protein [Scytonema sp. PMC 1070.18]
MQTTNAEVFEILGNSGAATLKFTLSSQNTNQVNEVGIFRLDANNQVNGFAPGNSGFAQAALKKGEVIFSALADNLLAGVSLTRNLQFGAGERLGFYFISNGTADAALAKNDFSNVFFSINQANNGNDYLQVNQDNGIFNLAWEQGDDNSFDDLNMTVKLQNTPLSLQNLIGNFQGQQEGELINLETFTGRDVKATLTLKREAAFENFVGFYKVENTQGTITDPFTGAKLNPSDGAAYAELAIRLREPGIELGVNNLTTLTVEKTFQGGYLYAPFLIANGNPNNLNGNFSQVYSPFIQGNSDKSDHIRLLADNVFGFEDLSSGGDNDFNDIIIQANFTVV